MYYSDDTILYLNGNWVKANEANTTVYGQSLHYGMSVFEGIRSYEVDGKPQLFRGKEHMERMIFSAKAIGIPFKMQADAMMNIAHELLERNKMTEAYIRPLVFGSPMMSLSYPEEAQFMMCCWPWSKLLGDQLTKLAISPYRKNHPQSCKMEAKVGGHYVNSILAATEAKARGYHDALQLDVDGNVAECSGANFFIEKDGVLFTPGKGHILPGLTRDTVLQLCKRNKIEVRQQRIAPHEVFAADSAFLVGTAAEISGVQSLDDQVFKKPWANSIGAKLQKEYEVATRSNAVWERVMYL
ncbi:MAG TPA: branched-chain-amino-acid transaminase [Saprospiraceae bacterium]|nr:branched-chain-amino-acid transaminase [Saprospiraceae bacterium]